MHVKISEARGDNSVIQFGKLLRSDPAGVFQLMHCQYDKTDPTVQPKFVVASSGKIPRKGRLRLSLEYGEKYTLIAQGDYVAGTVHTANTVLTAPFHVSIEAAPSDRKQREEAAKQAAKQAELREKHRPNPLRRAVNAALRR